MARIAVAAFAGLLILLLLLTATVEALLGSVPSATGCDPWQAVDATSSPTRSALAQRAMVEPACQDIGTDPFSAAGTIVFYARAQVGLPYQWGGDGPAAGERGFDCSGLTRAATEAAGIQVPRTAQTQFAAGPLLPAGQTPRAGDLVFFGTGPRAITHVGVVTTPGWMIDAPHRGAVVRLERIWTYTLVGYTRPR